MQAGKAIGAPCHRGLVGTLNWLFSSLWNLKGGRGVEVSGLAHGMPIVSAKIRAGENCKIEYTDSGIVISFTPPQAQTEE